MSLMDLLGGYGPDSRTGSVGIPGGGDLSSVRNSALDLPNLLERQRDAESGGRHTNPDGSLVTSSAGAQGIAQVMPATGVDPGFGVAPLRDQSEAENRRFQQDYMAAMLARYNGDQGKALAAYNWGAGNVDRIHEDRDWLSRTPEETQKYVTKILGTYEERGSSGGVAAQPAASGLESFLNQYADTPPTQAPVGETSWADRGRELGMTAGSFAQGFVGTAENLARLGAGEGQTDTEAALTGVAGSLGGLRRDISGWQQGLQEGLTPEAQRMGQLEWDNFGPNSIWREGTLGVLQAASHQAMQSLGPSIGPMAMAVVLQKLGVPANFSTMFGASEALMSAGLTAQQIGDNIDRTPTDELRANSPRFAELYDQYGDAKAREVFIGEAMGFIPLASGALTGAIAKGVSGPLDKVFGVDDGLTLGKRVLAGATTEIAQEVPQSGMEQVAQNYAEQAIDPSRDLMEGVPNAMIQGGALAGPMGGGFAGAFGSRPARPLQVQQSSVDGDVERAIRETTGQQAPQQSPPQQGIPEGAPPAPATEQPWNPAAAVEDPGNIDLVPNEGSLFAGTPAQPFTPPQSGWGQGMADRPEPDPNKPWQGAPNWGVKPNMRGTPPLPQYPPDDPRSMDVSGLGAPQQAEPFNERVGRQFTDYEQLPQGVRPRRSTGAVATPAGTLFPPSEPEQLPTGVGLGVGPLDAAAANRQRGMQVAPAKTELDVGIAAPQPYEANIGVEPKHGERNRTEMLGYRVRVLNEKGEIVKSQLFEGRKGAEFFANRARTQTPDNWRVEMIPARRTFKNDQPPEPEPVQDILAQVKDMQSGRSQRLGVYLTRETAENLDAKGQLDNVLRAGVPINNFDTYGGIMVARDERTAQDMMQMLGSEGVDIDQVLGVATGAGFNKPYSGPLEVIQRIDEDGSVVQESLVRPEEAQRKLMEMGPNARKVSMEWAMGRRRQLYAADQQAKAARETEAADQNARAADLQENFAQDEQVAGNLEDAVTLVDQGGSRLEVGDRLTQYAADVAREERNRRRVSKEIPAPEDVTFRGKDVIDTRRQATTDRRKAAELRAQRAEMLKAEKARETAEKTRRERMAAEAKETNKRKKYKAPPEDDLTEVKADLKKRADALEAQAEELLARASELTKSVSGTKKAQKDAKEAYAELYSQFSTAATKLAAIRSGFSDNVSLADLQQAEADFEDLKDQLKTFLEVEGGTTRSEALMAAATRFSPESKKTKLREAARRREAKREAAITEADEAQRPITQTKIKEGKLLPGETLDTPDVPLVGTLKIDPTLSVPATAARLRRVRKITRQPNSKKLVETLHAWLDPNSKAWEAQPGLTTKQQEEHSRALIELNQQLRAWLSDYKLALQLLTRAGAGPKTRNRAIQRHIAILIELQGQLRGETRTRATVADAAEYVANRIANLVIHGKRWGVASDLDIDGFWKAAQDGPVAFRNYLNETVASRESLPLPLSATKEQLEKLTLGQLNVMYAKAVETLSGERESNGLRVALVDGIMKANGHRFSKKKESIEYTYAPRNRRGKVMGPDRKVRRDVAPYTLMRETLINSYGVRGTDKAMTLDQLKHLYLNGGSAVVESPVGHSKDASKAADAYLSGASPTYDGPRGRRKTVEFEPAGTFLPTPLPLNVKVRRLPRSEKQKVILRAIAQQSKLPKGGKSDAKALIRSVGEEKTRYNPNVLLTDTAEREQTSDANQEIRERRKAATENLNDTLVLTDAYLASMKGWPRSPEMVHAKAYFRWLVEYANALKKAHLQSDSGLGELERVTEDLADLVAKSPEDFVAKMSKLMKAEQREQVAASARVRPELGKYRSAEIRAKSIALQHAAVKSAVEASDRLHDLWKGDPDYEQVIAPILLRISESIQLKGYPDYTATKEEREAVDFVLAKWSGLKELRKSLSPAQQAAAAKYDKADNAHDPQLRYKEFYEPIQASLALAGFWNGDVLLERKYANLFPPEGDFSQMGPIKVAIRGDSATSFRAEGEGDDITGFRVIDLNGVANQWVSFSPTGGESVSTIPTDRQVNPLVVKAINVNQAIVTFREIAGRDDARIADIAQAEAQMMEVLKAAGFWQLNNEKLGLGVITMPDVAPLIEQLQAKMDELVEKQRDASRDIEIPEENIERAVSETKYGSEHAAIGREINALRRQINTLQTNRHALKTSQSFSYRLVGERLRKGQMTKAEARRAADKLRGFDIPMAKTPLSSERLRQMNIGLESRRALSALGPTPLSLAEREELELLEERVAKGEQLTDVESRRMEKLREGTKPRRGVPMVSMPYRDAVAPATKEEANAMGRLRDHIRAGTTISGALHVLSTMENSFYTPLVQILQRVPNIGQYQIRLVDNLGSTGMFLMEENGDPAHVAIDSAALYEQDVKQQLHLVLHEVIHAATMGELTLGNPEVTKMWEDLRQATYAALGKSPAFRDAKYLQYGGNNLYEFVAEVFSNEALQRAMKQIRVANVEGHLWHRLIRLIRRIFGADPGYTTVFDVAVSLQYHTFSGHPLNEAGYRRYKIGYRGATNLSDEFLDRQFRGIPYAANIFDSAMGNSKAVQEVLARAAKIKDAGEIGGSAGLLNAMTMRQIWRTYKPHFGGEGGSLDKYMKAYFARNAASSEYVEKADRLSRDWTKLREENESAERAMSELMLDATMQKIHPDVDFKDKLNEHLSDDKRSDWAALNRKYNALPVAAQQIYQKARDYYRETNVREVQFMLANALRASKLWQGRGEIDPTTINLEDISKRQWLEKQLGINLEEMRKQVDDERTAITADRTSDKATRKEREKEFFARERELIDLQDEVKLLVHMASLPSMKQGPYFPIMRFGDYSVYAEKVVETKMFATEADRAAYRNAREDEDPTLQFSYPKSDDNLFHLTVKEVEYRMAETRSDAEKNQRELIANYGKDAFVSPVHLRAESFRSEAAIGSNRALQTLLGKLEGNTAAQAAIRHFYIQSLSDRSFRKREAKRKNIRGAFPEQQQRTFGAYAKAASYYTAQLQYGHLMADAKHEIEQNVHEHRDESKITAVRMGQVRNELLMRDKTSADLHETPMAVRQLVETGQLYMLFSPSYWMINATQPYMVTLPWLSGHTSTPQALQALANAQALIADPLATQAGKSGLGLKALWSRTAAEDAFSVIEDVEKTLKKRLGDDSPILSMLTDLKRESIIDLSFVAELRDVAEGKGKSTWARVMDATRVMAHLTEVNNRIMTAIAAYNVAIGNGMTHEKAVAFARDAVEETQMDYSAGNKPRLFSGADAWYKPLVFQFLQYAQHMWAMTIRHTLMAFGKDPVQRKIGIRVLAGLLSTHAAATGLIGVTPVAIKWAFGLLMLAAGGGDDPDRTAKNFVSGEYFDRVLADMMKELPDDLSHAVRKGLPTLAGADVSNRMAFLQTYMVDLNPKDADTLIGSLVRTFGGPVWGLGTNMVEGFKLLNEGDFDKALELMTPKASRDLIRATRYASEGFTDKSGKQIYDDMTPWQIFVQGLGFAPAGINEMYDKKGRADDARRSVEDEKARIRAAYNKAPTTGELSTVMADLAEYNARVSYRDRLTLSDLMKGKRRFDAAARDIRTYGISAGKRSRFYADADDPYNE